MLRVGSPVQLHSLVKQPELNSLCMEVTLVGASWVVVAGDQTGVDSIPYYMKFCGVPSCLALGVGALSGRGAGGRVPYCLRVIPRVQVAHCPADLLYADTRRPSDGEVDPLGDSVAES
eukprot:scaffold17665_cov61-Phaeocystis_antarctica.AAC.2